MKHETGKRGGKAIWASQRAARLANLPPDRGAVDLVMNRAEAERAQVEAEAMLKPTGELVTGAGEIVHLDPAEAADSCLILADTLKQPTMIAVNASEQRLEAAADAGVLEAAVDAAATANAGNSLERMLCHQAAAAHHAAMKLLARAALDDHDFNLPTASPRMPPVEQARLINAAARLMECYQSALLTLQRIRNNGTQRVVVQYVHVSGSAKAVVAGTVRGGAAGDGRGDPEK